MCLISLAFKVHPRYPLILIANRDEVYKRPARKAQFWVEEGYPNILAGKDMEAGGTWLGVHKDGKWGALTNYRNFEHIKAHAPSRGELVLDFLKQEVSSQEYLEKIRKGGGEYNGFNLLLGDKEEIFHYSNISGVVTQVAPGIHGLSNALLNTSWPKSQRANRGLEAVLKEEKVSIDGLFEILNDSTQAEEGQLPNTGLPLDMEKAVSSVFIKSENYGTRCSTLFLVKQDGRKEFYERTYDNLPAGDTPDVHYSF